MSPHLSEHALTPGSTREQTDDDTGVVEREEEGGEFFPEDPYPKFTREWECACRRNICMSSERPIHA